MSDGINSGIMKHIAYILLTLSVLACKEQDFYTPESGNGNAAEAVNKKEIDASCSVAPLNPGSNDVGMLSRGIIGQSTVAQLEANFIKLDEEVQNCTSPEDYRPTTGPIDWNNARTSIVNATVFSSPDATDGIGFRSLSFSPRLTYQIEELTPDGNQDPVIVGYISRMVGWYPSTEDVQVGEDVDATVSFTGTSSYTQVTKDGKTYDCVKFKNKLDGQTDVMMTDLREGRYQLDEFKNNDLDRDVQPYGHIFKNLVDETDGYEYCNYFSFKHYLTAVRLYVKVESSDLSLVSWKTIDNVTFLDQPQTVTISLPTEQKRGENSDKPLVAGTTPTLPVEGVDPLFGEALDWEDFANMPIVRTPMAENDAEHPEFAETPDYPVELENTISLEKTYLGYILLQPGKDAEFEVHTDAGVYKAMIPAMYMKDDGTATEILKAGEIYNIVVDMRADGSLDIVVGNEDFESFRNLTPYNETIKDFEYSNCFIISQDMMKKDDNTFYDGFYFQAAVPGRGEKGMITGTGADLYPKELYFTPHSARILWQDQPYLVTFVELVHGYVRFSLHEDCRSTTNPYQGNAVIAVYNEAGDILWSWHIWVNNGIKDVTYSSLSFDDPETNQYSVLSNVRIMNMNLGATKASWSASENDSLVLDCYGFYYQWGRKDPSPLPSSYDYPQSDMTTKAYYYMDEGTRKRVYRYLDLAPTVEMGALHPLEIVAPSQFTQTYANDWLSVSVDQLWGYNPSTREVEKKTIYDPCPYGYRVADRELYALFSYAKETDSYYNDTWSEVDGKGIRIRLNNTDNYFPFSGWRGHDRGRTDRTNAWYEVGNLGDYQDARVCKTSGDYMNHRGRSFLIKDNKFDKWDRELGQYVYEVLDVGKYTERITLDYANRISASPVRCVRYDGTDEEPANKTP